MMADKNDGLQEELAVAATFPEVLAKIREHHGADAFADHARIKGLLADYARGGFKGECGIAMTLLQEGVLQRLNEPGFDEMRARQYVKITAAEHCLVEEKVLSVMQDLWNALRDAKVDLLPAVNPASATASNSSPTSNIPFVHPQELFVAAKSESGKYGYINAQGEWVIPPRFEGVSGFAANGLAVAWENGKLGYINTKGEWVIAPRFGLTWGFAANGLASVFKNKKWGYINTKGEWIIPPRFEGAGDFAANGLAAAREDEYRGYGYINTKGEWVIPPRFSGARDFAANGLESVRENGKEGYINTQGEWVIPPRFESAWDFAANGLARVMENGKLGYINTKGEWVIPPRFESVGDFAANGWALVSENGNGRYINTKGEFAILPTAWASAMEGAQ